jgi:hypothetical protein
MDAHRYDQGRKRPVWFSPVLLAIALSPAIFQTTPVTCGLPGDWTLSTLELQVLGEHQIAFDSAQRSYDAWLPATASTMTVRAFSTDPLAEVTYRLRHASGLNEEGDLGIGGGQVVLDLPPSGTGLKISVKAPEGVIGSYSVYILVGCSDCDDGSECTTDSCDVGVEQCVHTPVGDGTPCDAGGGPGSGACDGAGVCAPPPPPVIGNCTQVQNNRALPKMCQAGNWDATAFLYTCVTPVTPTQDVPGGGTANGFSDPVSPYTGCEVPSSALAGQLAVDTFIDMDVFSSGDGNVTTNYNVVTVNAALGLTASLTELVDLTVITDISSGVPSTVTNSLNPAFYNTPVGAYLSGGNTVTLTGGVHIDVNTESVVPTSAGTVDIGFHGQFLLELFLTTAMQPLNIDGASCTFDLLGADAVCPVSGFSCSGPGDPICDDGDDCTQNVCSGVPFVCSNPNEPAGTSCDAGGGPGSGACDGAGVCAFEVP